jgi:hypothetical protein
MKKRRRGRQKEKMHRIEKKKIKKRTRTNSLRENEENIIKKERIGN